MIRRISLLFVLFIMLAVAVPHPNAAAGEEGRTGAAVMPEAELTTAPVEIDGQMLFRVRGASSYPAEQRAAAIGSESRRSPLTTPFKQRRLARR